MAVVRLEATDSTDDAGVYAVSWNNCRSLLVLIFFFFPIQGKTARINVCKIFIFLIIPGRAPLPEWRWGPEGRRSARGGRTTISEERGPTQSGTRDPLPMPRTPEMVPGCSPMASPKGEGSHPGLTGTHMYFRRNRERERSKLPSPRGSS